MTDVRARIATRNRIPRCGRSGTRRVGLNCSRSLRCRMFFKHRQRPTEAHVPKQKRPPLSYHESTLPNGKTRRAEFTLIARLCPRDSAAACIDFARPTLERIQINVGNDKTCARGYILPSLRDSHPDSFSLFNHGPCPASPLRGSN